MDSLLLATQRQTASAMRAGARLSSGVSVNAFPKTQKFLPRRRAGNQAPYERSAAPVKLQFLAPRGIARPNVKPLK
jgi:hypothetical protein